MSSPVKKVNSSPKTQARWVDHWSYRGFAVAGGCSLLLFAIVAVHEVCVFVMRIGRIEQNLRLLPDQWKEWNTGYFGTDSTRGEFADQPIRTILRKTRRNSEGNQSKWEEEQPRTCDVATGDDGRCQSNNEDESEGVRKRPIQNMGSALKERVTNRRRASGDTGSNDPTPYREKAVYTDENGNFVDPNQ